MFVIYSKKDCNSCTQAKQLLDNLELDYKYKVLGDDYDLAEFYSIAPRSHRAFPMIAKDGEYLGSLLELKALFSN